MSNSLPTADTVSEAWLRALEASSQAPSGRVVHLITTIGTPGAEVNGVRRVVDVFLAQNGLQPVDEVAETIFPASLVTEPAKRWAPDLVQEDEAAVMRREQQLFAGFSDILDLLLTANGNHGGTYFSRMVTWPGKSVGGVNQIAERIRAVRSQVRHSRTAFNALDLDIAADAESSDPSLLGLQVYAVTDRRNRGFPCLTHIDLTLFDGRLHMTAVYRHQYLISKAYGNLLGLSWLLEFIATQGGVDVGELVVHATLADSEFPLGRGRIIDLLETARRALEVNAR